MSKVTRRVFLASGAAVVAGCATSKGRAPAVIRYKSANEKLNVAAIGCGGKGRVDIGGAAGEGENVVALCDVDWIRAKAAFHTWPDAPRYKDFRKMLEKEKSIDAVTISTPDHTHAVAAMFAMAMGKHVYVQKPLTHSIHEARVLTEAARDYGVATQMGNQGHSMDGTREACEWIWDGAIGQVREVHCWTDRPEGGRWVQGIPNPLPKEPVPGHLDWNLWLGPAPKRDYNRGYAPRNWRGWWDFGCGALGDMGCHIMDTANWALHLGPPTAVECVTQEGNNDQTGPTKCVVKYEFPERRVGGKTLPPVVLYWYEGGILPPRPAGIPKEVVLGQEGNNGTLFVGSKGYLTNEACGGNPRLLPEALDKEYKRPAPTIERVGGPYKDWVAACRGLRKACSNFDYAGPLTETVLLGNVAVRSGARIEWDSEKMKVTNLPEADRFIKRKYRRGWKL